VEYIKVKRTKLILKIQVLLIPTMKTASKLEANTKTSVIIHPNSK